MVRRLLLVLSCTAAVVLIPGVAEAQAPPSSLAAIGDSITRGFNACGWYVDCTSRSWAAGDFGPVNSHYLRILTVNPDIRGRNNNVAESGADSADLAGQASAAVGLGVDYVTILMGANDACRSSESAMTSVSTYRQRVDAALAALKQGLPNARVFIASIPDIKRLWDVGKGSGTARFFWALGGICQAMLANPTSTSATDQARRDRVQQRVIDFNGQLAAACAAYGATCRYDRGAVFAYRFTLAQVSRWDYFHPNESGQRVLAEVTYQAGFGWADSG